jgi:hypothetical protein
MIAAGVFRAEDRVELMHGQLVQKMAINPSHKKAMRQLAAALAGLLPAGVVGDAQGPVSIGDSEPEPDYAVAVGPADRYDARHPGPGELLLVVEIADTSLALDRTDKLALYAAAKIPVYWVVNIPDRRVEVYTLPRGGKSPTYRQTDVYSPGQAVPVVLAGQQVGTIPVSELLP